MSTRLVVGITLLAVGCGGRYLRWSGAPPAATPSRWVIEVLDRREPKKGGEDARAVGVGTGFGGIPMIIRLDKEAASEIHDYLGQAALTSKSAPTDGAPSPRAVVEIRTMWCEVHAFVFFADVTLGVSVVDGAGNARALSFHTDDGATNCREAYRKALTKGFDAAAALFAQPNPT